MAFLPFMRSLGFAKMYCFHCVDKLPEPISLCREVLMFLSSPFFLHAALCLLPLVLSVLCKPYILQEYFCVCMMCRRKGYQSPGRIAVQRTVDWITSCWKNLTYMSSVQINQWFGFQISQSLFALWLLSPRAPENKQDFLRNCCS